MSNKGPSNEEIMAKLVELEKICGSRPSAPAGKQVKTERKRSAWQEHLSKCLKEPDVKEMKFGERMKECSKRYKNLKISGG